jgi:hypothetical protein
MPAADVILNDAPAVSGSDTTHPEGVIPKLEPGQDMYDSPSDSSPEPEASTSTGAATDKPSQDPPPPVKRKGGRKPVSSFQDQLAISHTVRSMLPRKSVSSGTGKLKLPFVSVGRSTSSNWKLRSSITRSSCRTYSKATDRLQMNV